MLRLFLRVTSEDSISNEHIGGTLKVDRFGQKVSQSRLRWYGHTKRRDDECVNRKVLEMKTKEEVFGSGEGEHAEGMKSCVTEVNGYSAVGTSDGKSRKKKMHGEYRYQPGHDSDYCVDKSKYKSYRRMLRISWTEHVTNVRCLINMANTKPTLLDGLLKRRLAFHGRLVRKGGNTLDLKIGRLHGTRPRGRSRATWLKDLVNQTNISNKEALTIPSDRKKWRTVGNPRRTPDE